MITKETIKNIQFDCKWNRYKAEQVDDFLEEVAQAFESLEKECAMLRKKVQEYTSAQQELEETRKKDKERADALIQMAERRRYAVEKEEEEIRIQSIQKRTQTIMEIGKLQSFFEEYKTTILRDMHELESKIEQLSADQFWDSRPDEILK